MCVPISSVMVTVATGTSRSTLLLSKLFVLTVRSARSLSSPSAGVSVRVTSVTLIWGLAPGMKVSGKSVISI